MSHALQLRSVAYHIASMDSGSGEAAILRAAADELDRLTNSLQQIATECRAPDYAEHFTAQDAWNLIRLTERNARAALTTSQRGTE